jgi:hypothetical protein
MTAPNLSKEIAEILEKWNAIEGRLKQAEQICGEAVIPAINELRYAGRQFIDAMMIYTKENLTPDDLVNIEKHLHNVRYNLMNADHDCTDAICLFFHERIKRIMDEYTRDLILKYFANFQELFDRMKGANDCITASRADRPNRISTYKALADFHIPMLYEFNQTILTSEPLMLANKKRTILKRNASWVIAGLFAVITTVLLYFLLRR